MLLTVNRCLNGQIYTLNSMIYGYPIHFVREIELFLIKNLIIF